MSPFSIVQSLRAGTPESSGIVASLGLCLPQRSELGRDLDTRMAQSRDFVGMYVAEPASSFRHRWPRKNVDHADWLNNRRIHNEIGRISPAEIQENYCCQIAAPELVTSESAQNPGRFSPTCCHSSESVPFQG
jgi:hypothetical protein